MAKIVFDIEDELKKRLLDSLDELQMDRKSWLEQCICAFLLRDAVEKIKKEEAAEAEAQLGNQAMPLPIGGFSLSEDVPPEVLQKVITESLKEGFKKLGIEIECKGLEEIPDVIDTPHRMN
ncbi:hypothetical protein [uncultured Parasutterella sp.]|uniref:hypothetical protein n=1 Tax=uncultured Parasutterella sp. TaxID=1263098 RepID=UPI002598814E|nr:hypothetical protein [uncultured Parasutterella sp.]